MTIFWAVAIALRHSLHNQSDMVDYLIQRQSLPATDAFSEHNLMTPVKT